MDTVFGVKYDGGGEFFGPAAADTMHMRVVWGPGSGGCVLQAVSSSAEGMCLCHEMDGR